ncbi:unnamed protein product [Strongylus vulgaris]|uniref:Uncharacterized protein n=1 Tax=Strongylus vulgaris TaxID=40348 RepID=A0A3P7LC33_STRVU|nr:unnamed protein product [Strongylus vulgaris]
MDQSLLTFSVLATCTQSHIVLVDPTFATLLPRAPPRCHQRRVHSVYVENNPICMNNSQSLMVDVVPNNPRSQSNEVLVVSCAPLGKEIIHERIFTKQMDIQISTASESFLDLDIIERNVLLVAARYPVPTNCHIISQRHNDVRVIQLTDEVWWLRGLNGYNEIFAKIGRSRYGLLGPTERIDFYWLE